MSIRWMRGHLGCWHAVTAAANQDEKLAIHCIFTISSELVLFPK